MRTVLPAGALLALVLSVSYGLMRGGAAGAADDAAVAPDRPKRTSPPDWGLYQIYWKPKRYAPELARETARFATAPDYVMFYRDLGRPFPQAPIEAIRAAGATPIVSLELWRWHGRGHSYLPDVVAGKYDAFFEAWAAEAKRDGGRVLLRFGFEFNGDWFTWSGDPPAFVAAWRRIHAIFARVGADRVEWVWCPNITSVPDKPENRMHLYYPGDEHVDWVGLDGYNWGANHDRWHTWQSFEAIHHEVLDDLAQRYPGKPIMICETGSVQASPGRKAGWIRDAFAALEHHPRVQAVVWFHFDKRREGEPNWRIDTSPEALQAFNATFAAPTD
ncbi:MAG: endoglucanase [bacterium]|nr:endoglucanase [bacterium]